MLRVQYNHAIMITYILPLKRISYFLKDIDDSIRINYIRARNKIISVLVVVKYFISGARI